MLNLIGAIYVVQLTADGALTILRFQHAARGLFFVFGATMRLPEGTTRPSTFNALFFETLDKGDHLALLGFRHLKLR
jgi:hypothetical protein